MDRKRPQRHQRSQFRVFEDSKTPCGHPTRNPFIKDMYSCTYMSRWRLARANARAKPRRSAPNEGGPFVWLPQATTILPFRASPGKKDIKRSASGTTERAAQGVGLSE